jgi:arylsulfatase A-like enzyme
MLNRRDAMKALAGGAAMPFLSQGQTRKPNFLFLLADDLGWGDATINGRKDWDMPNVDRLAAQGTTFTHWYSACPVCAPSRAALLTGKYGIHNGVRTNSADLPKSEVTIAEALKPLGYTTALVGNWHRDKNAGRQLHSSNGPGFRYDVRLPGCDQRVAAFPEDAVSRPARGAGVGLQLRHSGG